MSHLPPSPPSTLTTQSGASSSSPGGRPGGDPEPGAAGPEGGGPRPGEGRDGGARGHLLEMGSTGRGDWTGRGEQGDGRTSLPDGPRFLCGVRQGMGRSEESGEAGNPNGKR